MLKIQIIKQAYNAQNKTTCSNWEIFLPVSFISFSSSGLDNLTRSRSVSSLSAKFCNLLNIKKRSKMKLSNVYLLWAIKPSLNLCLNDSIWKRN